MKIPLTNFLYVNLKIQYGISHLSPGYEGGRRDVTILVIVVASLNPASELAVTDTFKCRPNSNEVKVTDV
jgi:hypothetical protein